MRVQDRALRRETQKIQSLAISIPYYHLGLPWTHWEMRISRQRERETAGTAVPKASSKSQSGTSLRSASRIVCGEWNISTVLQELNTNNDE